jgi:hypothetical protein
MFALGDYVVVELGVEPAQLGQLDQGVDRPSGLPVDKGDGHTVAGDDVPRRAVPWKPHRIGGRTEGACGPVEVAE